MWTRKSSLSLSLSLSLFGAIMVCFFGVDQTGVLFHQPKEKKREEDFLIFFFLRDIFLSRRWSYSLLYEYNGIFLKKPIKVLFKRERPPLKKSLSLSILKIETKSHQRGLEASSSSRPTKAAACKHITTHRTHRFSFRFRHFLVKSILF